MSAEKCVSCGSFVSPSAGRPRIVDGRIFLACIECPPPAQEPEDEPQSSPRRRLRDRLPSPAQLARLLPSPALAVPTLLLISTPLLSAPVEAPEEALPILALDGLGDATEREFALRVDAAEAPLDHDLMRVVKGGERIDINWYHPLAGERALPDKDDRRFGAERSGTRPECGRGHCGVDLHGETGTPIYAALPGRVERIVRDGDRKGGRYVKLVHEHGLSTFYMHLHDVDPTLEVGIEVAAGEPLGTLGKSGILHSAPHLHFAVARHREGGGERFVDPEPMLERATVLADPVPAR